MLLERGKGDWLEEKRSKGSLLYLFPWGADVKKSLAGLSGAGWGFIGFTASLDGSSDEEVVNFRSALLPLLPLPRFIYFIITAFLATDLESTNSSRIWKCNEAKFWRTKIISASKDYYPHRKLLKDRKNARKKRSWEESLNERWKVREKRRKRTQQYRENKAIKIYGNNKKQN